MNVHKSEPVDWYRLVEISAFNNGVDAAISKVQELIHRDIALTRQTDAF